MKVVCKTTINAPSKEVFDVFSDIPKADERISGIKKIEFLSSKKSGKGTKWRETRVIMGKEASEEMWISSFDAPNSYAVEAESHGMKYYSKYTFDEVEGKTTARLVFTGEPQTFSAKVQGVIWKPLMNSMVKKPLEQDMQDLKNYIEKS